MCLSSRNGDFKPTSVPIGTSIFVFPPYASLIYNCDFFSVHCGFKSVNTKHNRWSTPKVTWINLEELGGRIWTKVEKPLDYLTKKQSVLFSWFPLKQGDTHCCYLTQMLMLFQEIQNCLWFLKFLNSNRLVVKVKKISY